MEKKYYPNPLNHLNLMTLRFLDPNGDELKPNDNLVIKNINFFKSGSELLGIRLITNYFSRYEYKEGENIFIKDFKFIDSFITSFDKILIEKFINRLEGHKITNTFRLTGTDYQGTNNFNNVIFIILPIEINSMKFRKNKFH